MYYWDEIVSRYRDVRGRFVARDTVVSWVNQSLKISANVSDSLASYVFNGGLSVNDWEKAMRQEIKDEYIRQYLSFAGGRNAMTQADWGSIGGMLTEQYRYLGNFANDIAGGNLTEAQIRARSAMYVNSAREAAERARGRSADKAGFDSVSWVLNPQLENCFLAGTKILTRYGETPIEKIKVGQEVETLYGLRKVIRLFNRPYGGEFVTLQKGGRSVTCTPNHPFLTGSGWVRADKIAAEDIILYEDVNQKSLAQLAFPNSHDLIATCGEILVLGSIPALLCKLPVRELLETRMPMPPVSVCLDDEIADFAIDHKFFLDDKLHLMLYIQFIENIGKFLFEFCRVVLAKFRKTLHEFGEYVRSVRTLFLESFRRARSFGGIVFLHPVGNSNVIQAVAGGLGQLQFQCVGFGLDLGKREIDFVGDPLRPLGRIMGSEKDEFCRCPNGKSLGFPIAFCAANGFAGRQSFTAINALWHRFINLFRNVPIPAFYGTKTPNGNSGIIGLPAKFANFLHLGNSPIAQLYSQAATSTMVYNLEVEDVHHYVANGFIAHNCNDCIDFAGMGIQLVEDDPYKGAYPGSGDTVCLTNCGCSLSYSNSVTGEEYAM